MPTNNKLENSLKRLQERADNLELSVKLQPLQDFEDAKRLLAARKELVEKNGENFYLQGWDADLRKCLKQADGSYLTYQPTFKLGNSTKESHIYIRSGNTLERGNSLYLVTESKTTVAGTVFQMEYLNSSFTIAGSLKKYPILLNRTGKTFELKCSGAVADSLEKEIFIDGRKYQVKFAFLDNNNNPVKRFELEVSK